MSIEAQRLALMDNLDLEGPVALTETTIKNLKPAERTYTKSDGRGLYLEVLPTGGMAWRYRYHLNGKQEKLSLGKYPALSLKNARTKRDEAAQRVAQGISPATEKQHAKLPAAATTTVKEFGERFFKEIVAKDRKDVTLPRRYFDKCIVPAIGAMPIAEVTTPDVRKIIWAKKDEGFDAAAGALRGVLKRLFDYACTCGVSASNPVLALPMRHVHKAKSRERALVPAEIGLFLNAVYESNIRRQFKVALHLTLITMVRKSELLLAQWSEVNLDAAEWVIPAERTKMSKAHMVFLSTQAIALFRQLKALAGESAYVLPGRGTSTKPFAHNSLNNALKVSLQGTEVPAFVIHDFRRTASTILNEEDWQPRVIERALSHVVGGTEGAYNKSDLKDQRRALLQAWADRVDDFRSGKLEAPTAQTPVASAA